MSYFSKFPKLVYDIKGNGNDALFTHILKRVKLHSAASANSKVFDYYQVVEGEKPEDIAHKYYGDANYHWVILLVNDITDRYHDWPMSEAQFLQFVNATGYITTAEKKIDWNGKGSMKTSDEMLQFIITYLPYKKNDENINLEN